MNRNNLIDELGKRNAEMMINWMLLLIIILIFISLLFSKRIDMLERELDSYTQEYSSEIADSYINPLIIYDTIDC